MISEVSTHINQQQHGWQISLWMIRTCYSHSSVCFCMIQQLQRSTSFTWRWSKNSSHMMILSVFKNNYVKVKLPVPGDISGRVYAFLGIRGWCNLEYDHYLNCTIALATGQPGASHSLPPSSAPFSQSPPLHQPRQRGLGKFRRDDGNPETM